MSLGFVGEHHRLQQKEELQLLLGEGADAGHQNGDVTIDLPFDDCRRMPLRRLEVAAVLGAFDLNQPFRRTTYGAYVLS